MHEVSRRPLRLTLTWKPVLTVIVEVGCLSGFALTNDLSGTWICCCRFVLVDNQQVLFIVLYIVFIYIWARQI